VELGVGSAAAASGYGREVRAGTQETDGCEATGLSGMSRRAANLIVEAAGGLHLDRAFRD